jgi:ABC-type phosphate transport system auxiliary subunit
MAVDIKAELERQLGTIEDKINKAQEELEAKTAALREELAALEVDKDRVATTLAFLTGKITLPKKGGKKTGAVAGGIKRPMSDTHKLKIKVSNIQRRFDAAPAIEKAELQKNLKEAKTALAVAEKAEK